jgi:hypothetical protein
MASSSRAAAMASHSRDRASVAAIRITRAVPAALARDKQADLRELVDLAGLEVQVDPVGAASAVRAGLVDVAAADLVAALAVDRAGASAVAGVDAAVEEQLPVRGRAAVKRASETEDRSGATTASAAG